jgi:FkbH-like protein/FkbM family methyltransferase
MSSPRPETRARFRVGLRSLPYLADHGLQDTPVLPGALFVDMARTVQRERGVHGDLHELRFHSPVILADEDAELTAELEPLGDGTTACAFRENGATQPAAELRIVNPALVPAPGPAPRIEAFQTHAEEATDAQRFYALLERNGNQYGPAFRRVSWIWRAGARALARIEARGDGLHPCVIDAMAQLLTFFVIDRGRTAVLRSIGGVELADGEVGDTLWAWAENVALDGERVTGDVRAFDASGRLRAALSRVAFTLLERAGGAEEPAAPALVVASNFTAEPLEDALAFWSAHFRAPLRVQFAPYDQVFQQLLDPGGALRANRHGANAVLLSLEEWARRERAPLEPRRGFGAHPTCVLPNGLEVAHLQRYEADYLYREIFEDQCYLKHGIGLAEGATVLDIGANIGLFSLFVMSRCRDARVYAFEPAPAAYAALRANLEAYGGEARAFDLGVADRPKTATLTFYENSSVFSGFFADEARDRAALEAIVRNTLRGEAADEDVAQLTAERLRRTTHECRMTTVSEIIREHALQRVDLLKIDAEKSELDILRGIDERDWPKIAQIVVEIHDPTGEALQRVERLLVAKGYACALEQERLLERSGLFNLYATRGRAAAAAAAPAPGLQRNVEDFCAALRVYAGAVAAPLVVCVCPRSPGARADPALDAALEEAERTLLERARALPGVRAIGSAELLRRYPVADYYDPHGRELGHVPYTPEGYAAIGTALYRALFGLKRRPFKVIVLDCDNTLWRGACGEDGARGVELSAPHRALQEFMLRRMRAGMLLALCSKNNEQDVLDVFEQRADMVLRREHLIAWRINWASKAENLRALARELDLGLDSFVFLDDNPVECAEVRARCPEVLTLQLPPDAAQFPAFLEHAWAFDQSGATEEDRQRTRMYRENAARRRFRDQAGTLREFIAGLELRVQIDAAAPADLGRVSQLTLRTNQFNFSTVGRSEAELRALLEAGQRCAVVRVADRFGEYGLVGVVLYALQDGRLLVDTLLLSCRVLGKGVEHAVLAWLGQRALVAGARRVELEYRPTPKNAPVREFLRGIGAGEPGRVSFEAERLARLRYEPAESAPPAASEGTAQPAVEVAELSAPLQAIAGELCDIARLQRAIEAHRLAQEPPAAAPDIAPGGALRAQLLEIWRKVLGRSRIGMNENFFDLGGTSLKAVQVVARIRRELGRSLSVVGLFESPTVSQLAAKLGAAGAAAPAAAAARGERRRSALKRRAA